MFDTMISKTLIQWIWLGWSALIVLGGIFALFQSGSLIEAFVVLLGIALGLLLVRVLCEQMIVIFLMHENLTRSAHALEEMQRHQLSINSRLGAQPVQQASSQAARSSVTTAPDPAAAETPRIAQRNQRSGWDSAYDSKKE